MKRAPNISDAEWLVMKLLWRRSPQTALELSGALRADTGWEDATVKTLLTRLLAKKAVRFERQGKAYLYSAAVPEEACQHQEAESFLNRVFDGALTPMMAHFLKSRRLSPDELRELKSLVAAMEKRK